MTREQLITEIAAKLQELPDDLIRLLHRIVMRL